MRTCAVYNIKGGVGKTASAVNLGWLAARDGLRTLIWDLDPQGAASFTLRIRPKVRGGTKRLLRGRKRMLEAIKASDYERLDLLPADFSYRNLDLRLDRTRDPKHRLERLLEPMRDDYDLVLLDCAPGISLVSENVFEASDALLVPTIPTVLSLRTLARLMKHLKGHSISTRVLPFFAMVDRRKALHRRVREFARTNRLGFLEAEVPFASQVELMGVRREPVGLIAPRSAGARAYAELWRELRGRLEEKKGKGPTRRSVNALLKHVGAVARDGSSAPAGHAAQRRSSRKGS